MHTTSDILYSIEHIDPEDLDRVQRAIDQRRQQVRASSVVERRDHLDGILQLEYRTNPKTGKQRGPYWYFKYRVDGSQKTVYVGATDEPERKLAEKRGG